MASVVSAMEMRQKLGEILNRVVMLNEEIVIERAGKQVARLSSLESGSRQNPGKLDFRKSAGLGRELWREIEAGDYLEKERREWD